MYALLFDLFVHSNRFGFVVAYLSVSVLMIYWSYYLMVLSATVNGYLFVKIGVTTNNCDWLKINVLEYHMLLLSITFIIHLIR